MRSGRYASRKPVNCERCRLRSALQKQQEINQQREQRAQQRLQPNGRAQPNALVQPNAQAQRGERRNGVARVTPQTAQQGRFAARFAARAQDTNFRAGTVALAPRRAWSLGLRAAFVPWYGPGVLALCLCGRFRLRILALWL